MLREALQRVTSGRHLSLEEAAALGRTLVLEDPDPLLCGALLAAWAARGERGEEIAGLAEALRGQARTIPGLPGAVDTCGTGGDGRGTWNVSTAAALTAASLGLKVAKHGNRSVSSACGSSDLLLALGYPVEEPPEAAQARLEALSFCYLHAPLYHPAAARMAPLRKALGIRTIFNLLGPLLNPARVRHQVAGVCHPRFLRPLGEAFRALGSERVLVLHGEGGYDEAVLWGRTWIVEATPSGLRERELLPQDFGLQPVKPSAVAGGAPSENAVRFLRLLDGKGPRDGEAVVAANTALALLAAGAVEDLREGTGLALRSLREGEPGRFLRKVLAFRPGGAP